MALISEWMQQCGKKVLDNAGIVRDACSQQLTVAQDKAGWRNTTYKPSSSLLGSERPPGPHSRHGLQHPLNHAIWLVQMNLVAAASSRNVHCV